MPLSRGQRSIAITVIGAGTLATALATAFRRRGHRISEIVSRNNAQSFSRARKLAMRVGAQAATLRDASFTAKLTWICVPDDAISEVAAQISVRRDWKHKIAVHSSGALGSNVLTALREAGGSVASAHPLMTFVTISKTELHGVPFAIEGDPKALAVISAFVKSIGGKPFRIAAELKPAYHLFGFFSSPALVALMAAAQQVGELTGFDRRKSRKLMEPIVRQTIDNLFRSNPQRAFSGPLRRGDLRTVRKHLDVLKGQPELLAFYKSLSRIALQQLPVGKVDALRRLMS
jgi:predicted short-subunit dehydrogenase-like oxidoreductase (DUF2520 family)